MTTDSLTHPLPFFHHAATARVLYIAPGPCPLVFSISLKDIGRHAPVVNPGPVLHKTTHPFGQSTSSRMRLSTFVAAVGRLLLWGVLAGLAGLAALRPSSS